MIRNDCYHRSLSMSRRQCDSNSKSLSSIFFVLIGRYMMLIQILLYILTETTNAATRWTLSSSSTAPIQFLASATSYPVTMVTTRSPSLFSIKSESKTLPNNELKNIFKSTIPSKKSNKKSNARSQFQSKQCLAFVSTDLRCQKTLGSREQRFDVIQVVEDQREASSLSTNTVFLPQRRLVGPSNKKMHTTSTSRHLFFRAGEDQPPSRQTKRQNGKGQYSSEFEDAMTALLNPSSISFPITILLPNDDINISSYSNASSNRIITIRPMEMKDLPTILKICINEFGTGSTLELNDFPLLPTNEYNSHPYAPKLTIPQWYDRFSLEPMIRCALGLKIQLQQSQYKQQLQGKTGTIPPGSSFVDPTLLVMTCRTESTDQNSQENNPNSDEVVGMIEVSLQPPQPSRNPPSFPIWGPIKTLYSTMNALKSPQGWITNMLIEPKYRGYGYSKLLLATAEGLLKQTATSKFDSRGRSLVNSIYLHVDADEKSGKIPQSLYLGMGYEPASSSTSSESSFIGDSWSSSINIINGVPLLCLYKQL